MIDIHNHMLPSVDDGSKSIKESIDIIKKMSFFGVKAIILTPHYISLSDYNSDKFSNEKIFKELKKEIELNNIDVEVYLGNEIYVNEDIYNSLEKGKVSTLNNTKYILIEFPLDHKLKDAHTVVYNLVKMGYVPIIAHPERYIYYSSEEIIEFINEGALLQGNIMSYYEAYGTRCKEMFIKLVKMHAYSFLSTDIHSIKFVQNDHINNIKEDLVKYIDEGYINSLLELNATRVINNEDVFVSVIKYKKTIRDIYKDVIKWLKK